MEMIDIRFIEFTLIVIMVSIIVIGIKHIGLQGKILKELKTSNYAHSSAMNYIYPLHDMIRNSFIALRSDVRTGLNVLNRWDDWDWARRIEKEEEAERMKAAMEGKEP